MSTSSSSPAVQRSNHKRCDHDGLEASARRLESSGLYRVLRRIHRPPTAKSPDDGSLILLAHSQSSTGRPDVSGIAVALATFEENGLGDVVALMEGPPTSGSRELLQFKDEVSSQTALTPAALEPWLGRIAFAIAYDPLHLSPAITSLPALSNVPWVDLRDGVDWVGLGMDRGDLVTLLAHLGLFGDPSTARGGCEAIAEILSTERWLEVNEAPLAQLRRRLEVRQVEIVASGPTYSLRDQLKQRGYRWGGSGTSALAKSWRVVVPYSSAAIELAWLRERMNAIGGTATMRERHEPFSNG